MEIKVGILLSYDYDYLKTCIPLIYDQTDKIVLAKDKHCRTYTNNTFEIAPEFYIWLEQFDSRKIIQIYEDDFYVAGLTPMENEIREREMLYKSMGAGGWLLQIDADEYFIGFSKFVEYLKHHAWLLNDPHKHPITYNIRTSVLYKQLENGFLVMNEKTETLPIAVNYPCPGWGRHGFQDGVQVYLEFLIVHHSWARSPEEVKMKLYNWSHSGDFNMESYFNLWNAVDDFSYKFLRDFHPNNPGYWPKLTFIPGKNVDDINDYYARQNHVPDNGAIEKIKNNYYVRDLIRKIRSK